jgi:hypothetical protein
MASLDRWKAADRALRDAYDEYQELDEVGQADQARIDRLARLKQSEVAAFDDHVKIVRASLDTLT